jgi:hypothetical protein
MKFRRVIQAEQAAFHVSAGGELGDHRSQVTPGALDSAGGFEFGEEANNHAQSLPTAAPEGKAAFAMTA